MSFPNQTSSKERTAFLHLRERLSEKRGRPPPLAMNGLYPELQPSTEVLVFRKFDGRILADSATPL